MPEQEPSRFKRRLAARRANPEADPGAAELLTDEDREALAGFVANIDAATDLLQSEITAIGRGNLRAAGELYEQKAEILKRIELKTPVVEPFLRAALAKGGAIRDKIVAFRLAVQENSVLLERMSQATANIIREVDKIRDRHSLSGLYGKSGRRLTDGEDAIQRIDKTI